MHGFWAPRNQRQCLDVECVVHRSSCILLESELFRRWLWLARQVQPYLSPRSPRGALPRSAAPWGDEE
eukprot:5822269-Pleurochrysis_carterae.AAC.1